MGISIVKPHSRDCLSSQASRGYVTLATYFPYTGLLIKIYTCIRAEYCFVSFNVILAFFSKVWYKLIRERVVLEPLVPFFEWLTGSMNGSFYFLPYTFNTSSFFIKIIYSKKPSLGEVYRLSICLSTSSTLKGHSEISMMKLSACLCFFAISP